MGPYLHQLPDWPRFHWDHEALTTRLADARYRQGRLIGQMESLGLSVRDEAVLRTLTEDVVTTSEIEGERLDPHQVRSSVARRLGMGIGELKPADRLVDGVVEMMLDATGRYDQPLTEERLFSWQAALFPTGGNGLNRIIVGAWRDDRGGPMQVVSGPLGRARVHYEAPAAARLPEEMRRFVEWFNTDHAMEPVLKAALAHLWFVSIHPFEDGNGRVTRAIADMAMARSEQSARRFFSISGQIRRERHDYYRILEQMQKTMDITPWMEWFLGCMTRAIESAQVTLSDVLARSRAWEKLRDMPLNDRQKVMINRLLDGFQGKLTSSKWASIAKASHDTALRDIQQLVDLGILIKDPTGGRSTSYSLAAF